MVGPILEFSHQEKLYVVVSAVVVSSVVHPDHRTWTPSLLSVGTYERSDVTAEYALLRRIFGVALQS